jgi:hypothetical protein
MRSRTEAATGRDPFDDFRSLPRRVFLDTCTLQTLPKHGEFVWEGVEPDVGGDAGASDLLVDLWALRYIFTVMQRGMFDLVVSEASLDEVAARCRRNFTNWGLEVYSHWMERITEYQGHAFARDSRPAVEALSGRSFRFLSEKDRRLLADALALECDAFLTMEKKLPRNARYIECHTGLRLLRPPEYWLLLHPWASLYC